MYGRDEYRYALRRIGDVTRDLEAVSERIHGLCVDLREDDVAATQKADAYLQTAILRVASALGQCDLAVQHLPTPVAR